MAKTSDEGQLRICCWAGGVMDAWGELVVVVVVVVVMDGSGNGVLGR